MFALSKQDSSDELCVCVYIYMCVYVYIYCIFVNDCHKKKHKTLESQPSHNCSKCSIHNEFKGYSNRWL